FVLLPVGCVLVAMEPICKALLYRYRCVRLYSLSRLLCGATPELALTPVTSRRRDLLATGDPWEQLHRRVIEIRDRVFYLYDSWASKTLLAEANAYVSSLPKVKRPELLAVACWLEVTRRAALAGQPKARDRLDNTRFPGSPTA